MAIVGNALSYHQILQNISLLIPIMYPPSSLCRGWLAYLHHNFGAFSVLVDEVGMEWAGTRRELSKAEYSDNILEYGKSIPYSLDYPCGWSLSCEVCPQFFPQPSKQVARCLTPFYQGIVKQQQFFLCTGVVGWVLFH